MQKLLCTVAISFMALSFSKAQQAQPNLGCVDKSIILKADDIKAGFMRQGMSVYREAMMGMDPDNPFPVGVKLEKDHLYQLLFIPNQSSKSAMLELYDGDDNKIAEKGMKMNDAPGYIIYSFVPDKTDMYLVVLSQQINASSTCGNFTIMEKRADFNTAAEQPAPAARYQQNIGNYPNQQSNSNRYIGNTPKEPEMPAPTPTERFVDDIEAPAKPKTAPASKPQPINSNRYVGNTPAPATAPQKPVSQPSKSDRYIGNTPVAATTSQKPVSQPSNSNRYIGNTATTAPAAPASAPANNQPSNSNRYIGANPQKEVPKAAPASNKTTTTNTSNSNQSYHSNRYIGNSPEQKPATPPPAPKQQYGNQVPNSNRYLGSDIDKK